MANNNKFGMFYVIVRLCLAILTLLSIVIIIIDVIRSLSNGTDVGWIIWAIICLLVSFLGFYGAWKEHFMATLVFGITELILLLAGISISGIAVYARVAQVLAVIVAFIYCWLLHSLGKADYKSVPFFK